MTFSFIYILLLLGYIFSYGTFDISGLAILSVSFLLLFKYRAGKVGKKDLIITLILALTLSLLVEKLLYPSFVYANHLIKVLLVISLLLSSCYFFKLPFIKPQTTFYILLTISFFIRIFIIFASPDPTIDAYHLLKEAPQHLMAGVNPYQAFYTKIYPQVTPDYYTYFPGSIFFFLPVVLFLNDPRWLYITVYAIIALLLKKAVQNKIKSQLITLILFYQPLSLIMFEQGFSEILLSGLLLLALYLIKVKKINTASFVLGVLVATKQSMLFILPFFLPVMLKQSKNFRKTLLFFFLIPILSIVPFIFWSYSDFWHDTIYYHLNINSIRTDLVGVSLNYLSLSIKLFSFDFTSTPVYSALLVSVVYAFVFLKKPIKKIADVPLALVIFFLGFHLFGVQAYMNYYFLISQLLLFSQIFNDI